MSIVFRNVKGSALTYTEMDRNLAQFFYSASMSETTSTLKLHYNGHPILNSEGQNDFDDTRFVEVPLASGTSNLILQPGNGISIGTEDGITTITNTGTAAPGEPVQSIQFNKNSSFAGDSTFLYDSSNKRVGLGFTSITSIARRLHIAGASSQGAIIRLQSFFDINPNNIGEVDETAFLEICSGGERSSRENPENIFGKFGKVDQGEDPQLHINRYFQDGKTYFSFGQDHTISHTVLPHAIAINALDTKRNLAVVGEHGIGIGQNQDRLENRIRPLPNDVWTKSFTQFGEVGNPPLNVTRKGLAIHSPMNGDDGGNMIIAISDNLEGVNSQNRRHPNRLLINSYADGDNMTINAEPVNPIASFLSNGTTGIGTPNPNTDIRLDINGNYRGKTAFSTLSADNNNGISIELDFNSYSFLITTIDSTFASPLLTWTVPTVPPVGTKGVALIINNYGSKITISNVNVYSPNKSSFDIATGKRATVSFISDGTDLYVTGVQLNLEK